MSESAFLHIQDRESGPIRVVELPWILVRIGRAAFCEVRLDGPELAPEACRLQRRGRTWYLVPLAASGPISLGRQSVQAPCPLPLEVPFQLGDSTLVLRKAHSPEPIRPPYQPPDPSRAPRRSTTSPPEVTQRPAASRPDAGTRERRSSIPRRAPATPAVPLLDASLSRAAPPDPENPWAARWRAAAARLKQEPDDGVGVRPPTIRSPERYRGIPLKEADPPPAGVGVATAQPPAWAPPEWADSPVPRPPMPAQVRRAEPPGPPAPGPAIEVGGPSSPTQDHAATMAVPPSPAHPEYSSDAPSIRGEDAAGGAPASPEPPSRPVEGHPCAATDTPGRFPACESEATADIAEGRGDGAGLEPQCPDTGSAPGHPGEATVPGGVESPETPDWSPATLGTVVDDPRPHDLSAWFQYYSPDVTRPVAPAPAPTAPAPAEAAAAAKGPVGRDPHTLLVLSDEGLAGGVTIRQDLLPSAGCRDLPGGHAVNLVMPDVVIGGPHPLGDLGHLGGPPPGVAEPIIGSPGTATFDPRPVDGAAVGAGAGAARSDVRTATLLGGAAPSADAEQDRPAQAGADSWTSARPGPEAEVSWDLPSAREILAAAGRRATPRHEPAPAPASWDRSIATMAREPASWSPPLWLAWPPAALLVLVLGALGSTLAFRWARDSYNAAIVHRRLLSRDAQGGRGKPLPEGVQPPHGSWWSTTPQHLAEWSAYLDRVAEGGGRTEEAGELLDAAVRIAPLHPTARLMRAERADGPGEPDRLAKSLGLSRDVVSLRLSARRLRQAGKKEPALRAYRHALQVACRAGLALGDELGFDDDPEVRRYLLPGESLALELVRELAGERSWSFEDWSRVVPADTVAELAAARFLKEQDHAEAAPRLERMAGARVDERAPGRERAVRLAVKAEASALLSRWKEAGQAYRQAIDLAEDPTTRRSWWFNLANVASRLDDQRQRDLAIHAALEATTSDDIGRRALEIQRSAEPLTRLRPGGTRAN